MDKTSKLPSRVEVDSKGRVSAPFTDDLTQALNYYFAMHLVFSELERLLTGFINAVALPHVSSRRRTKGDTGLCISFSDADAKRKRQDAFYIMFTPDAEESNQMPHGDGYICKGLAKGFLFEKKIEFYATERADPGYLDDALAAIAKVFKAQGWTIKNRGW